MRRKSSLVHDEAGPRRLRPPYRRSLKRDGFWHWPPAPLPPDPVLREKPIVDENGCTVRILGKTVSVYDADGKLLRQENKAEK